MEASKSSQEDLKSIMATTKEINKEKQSFRNTEQVPTARTDTSRKAINSRITTLKTKKDSVNDMNEMTQLRLQMTMDRKNKVMTALSNIMKRISGTQDQIISNLK
jgi:hypothetical protein